MECHRSLKKLEQGGWSTSHLAPLCRQKYRGQSRESVSQWEVVDNFPIAWWVGDQGVQEKLALGTGRWRFLGCFPSHPQGRRRNPTPSNWPT
jgi:hypothetical protein